MNPEEQIERPVGTLITAVLLAVTTTWIAIRFPATLDSFDAMFRSFGADLPAPTRLVLRLPYAWWLLALPAIALLARVSARPRLTRAELRRMKIAQRLMLIAAGLAFGLAAWAIYLPIFKLGAVV